MSFLLALKDGDWCAVPVADPTGPRAALQQRRIALQARSAMCAYIGAQTGWWLSALRSQLEKQDDGKRQAIHHLQRLLSDSGTIGQMIRAFSSRRDHLLRVFPYLTWLVAS
jgi:hypothetical protein